MRAESLVAAGLVDMLHPDMLTPRVMRAALGRLLGAGRPRPDDAEYAGAERAANILTRLAGPVGSRTAGAVAR